VNVDVDEEEVWSVDENEVRAGYGDDNPKTKWRHGEHRRLSESGVKTSTRSFDTDST
jgi:hypothetical protein